MSGHLILLGTPRSLRVSRMRENSFTRLDTDCELTKLAGRDCAAWVKARDDQGKIVLVETTNYLPRQTAIYAQWLLFENEAELQEFLKEFPQYRLDARLAKTREERQALAAGFDRELIRRDFDLSRVRDERQRISLARRYIEIADKLRKLSADIRLSESTKELETEWQDKL